LLETLRQNIANLQMMSAAIAQIDVLANFAHQARLNTGIVLSLALRLGLKFMQVVIQWLKH
jgi:DNA mismatch repair protein MutS